MPELIGTGSSDLDRWRRAIPAEGVTLGRAPASGWAVPWDDQVSREHVELRWQNDRLHVRRLSTGRNPVFYGGRPVQECSLDVGEHFVIGGTTFLLVDERASVSLREPTPLNAVGYPVEQLRRARYRDADHRMEVLSNLPHVLRGASSDEELFPRLVNLLLTGIASADAVAIVRLVESGSQVEPNVQISHWDRRNETAGRFHPSQQLIVEAVNRRRQSVLHIWKTDAKEFF